NWSRSLLRHHLQPNDLKLIKNRCTVMKRLYKLENLDIPYQVSKAVDEIVMDAVDWAIQAPLRDRFRDFPEADMKEILHHRMWETKSYEAREDHKKLYEALEKSMDRDHSDQLLTDLAEARKKKKRRHESPKTPVGSLPHQPPPLPPPAGPSGTSGSSGAYGSSQLPPPPPPPSNNQSDQSKTQLLYAPQRQLHQLNIQLGRLLTQDSSRLSHQFLKIYL
ncbi:hypothetical protein Tco_1160915, partial [Tanacetum coccineum]